jgi:hypothetical protein
MSHIVSASNQGTLGVHPASVEVMARNSETVDIIEVGDLVRFDTAQASSIPGQGTAANGAPSNSKFANVKRNILVLGESFGIYGVAQQQILPGKTGKIMVVGVTRVNCVAGNYGAGQTVGVPSSAVTAQVSNSAPVIGLGTVLTPGTNVTSVEVMFDGSFGLTERGRGFGDGPLVYGSTRAGRFLRDAQAGTDSLDLIILGDSNSGSSIQGSYGYQAGMSQALTTLGVTLYGTALTPFIDRSRTGQARFYGMWNGTFVSIAKDANYQSGLTASLHTPDALATPYSIWNFDTPKVSYGSSTDYQTVAGTVSITGTAGQFSTTTATIFQVGQAFTIHGTLGGTGSITGYTNPGAGNPQFYYIIATNGTTTFQLSATRGGPPITTTAGTPTGLTYRTGADYDDWLFIPSGASTLYKGYGVGVDMNHPLAANGVVQFLRVRYGQVNAAGGQFIPNVLSKGSANALTRLYDGGAGTSGAVSTQLGGGLTAPTFNMAEVQFTANGKGHDATAIGYNTNGTQFSSGPGVFLCQSLYRKNTKGFAVHIHAYQSGETSTDIAGVITGAPISALKPWLQEIRQRQVDAGGSGRVMLFMHSGINGADTPTTWTNAHINTWNRYKQAWTELGYSLNDLAIVSIVGVQRNLADTSGNGADLVAVRAAANLMVKSQPDMTVVDVKQSIPFSAMLYGDGNGSYYQIYNNNPTVAADITVHLSGGFVPAVAGTTTGTATATTANSITLTGTSAVAATGYWVGARLNIGEPQITNVSIGASGVFTTTTNQGSNLVAGQQVRVSGTLSGTGSITGYSNPTTYYIVGTPTATTFTLSATFNGSPITTSAGTSTGLTFSYLGPSAYQDTFITEYNGATGVATVAQWPGNQPSNGNNIPYTLTRKAPSDGYTAVSHVILTSLLAES